MVIAGENDKEPNKFGVCLDCVFQKVSTNMRREKFGTKNVILSACEMLV